MVAAAPDVAGLEIGLAAGRGLSGLDGESNDAHLNTAANERPF
jgi:hypothetical protein